MSASATATTSAAPTSATRAAVGRASADLARTRTGESNRRHHPGERAVPVPPLPPQWRGTTMADHWPLQDFIEYGALPSAVPSARLHTRQIVWEWGLTALTETVELLVSELVTNGIAATHRPGHPHLCASGCSRTAPRSSSWSGTPVPTHRSPPRWTDTPRAAEGSCS